LQISYQQSIMFYVYQLFHLINREETYSVADL